MIGSKTFAIESPFDWIIIDFKSCQSSWRFFVCVPFPKFCALSCILVSDITRVSDVMDRILEALSFVSTSQKKCLWFLFWSPILRKTFLPGLSLWSEFSVMWTIGGKKHKLFLANYDWSSFCKMSRQMKKLCYWKKVTGILTKWRQVTNVRKWIVWHFDKCVVIIETKQKQRHLRNGQKLIIF